VDWVFFLDADDILTPNAFEAFGRCLSAEPDLDAVWGLICALDDAGQPELRDGQPERIDSREKYLATPPFLGVQIGAFVRAGVAAGIGFDTAMDTGEDYRFYCALWAGHRCAKRPEIFFLNRRGAHSTGPRSATGADWRRLAQEIGLDAARPDHPLDLGRGMHRRGRPERAQRHRQAQQPGSRATTSHSRPVRQH
jgi:hypothetical protein